MTASTVLVVGANGTVATNIVTGLKEKGAHVKAASRKGEGVDGVVFDITDPATFGPALDGVDSVFLLVPGGAVDAYAFASSFLTAATKQKKKIVLMTALGVDAVPESPYARLEQLLTSSGAPYVILRPNWFSDNFRTYWGHGVKTGLIAVPAGDAACSFIDVRDIAASAVGALTSSSFDNNAFNLTGPQAHTYAEAAALLSEIVGHQVRYQHVDDDAFVAGLVGVGVPEAYARMLASIFVPVKLGYTAVVTDNVKTLTGKAPRSLETWAKDNAARL